MATLNNVRDLSSKRDKSMTINAKTKENLIKLHQRLFKKAPSTTNMIESGHKLLAIAESSALRHLRTVVLLVLLQVPLVYWARMSAEQVLCAYKVWRFDPTVKPAIALRLGKMSRRAQITAAFANIYEDFWPAYRRFWNVDLQYLFERRHHLFCAFSNRAELVERLVEEVAGLPANTLKEYPQFRYIDAAGVTKRLGKGKAVKEALSKSNSKAAAWALLLARGNADNARKFLAMPYSKTIKPTQIVAEFLRTLPVNTQLKLLQQTAYKYRGEEFPLNYDTIADACRLVTMLGGMPDNIGRIRCWFSLHEDLSKEYVRRMPDGDLTIPEGWPVSLQHNNWEMRLPTSVAELKVMGMQFNNCVGSYAELINQGGSVVFGIYENGEPTHCVEWREGYPRFTQFYKPRNMPGDDALEAEVWEVLTGKGLITMPEPKPQGPIDPQLHREWYEAWDLDFEDEEEVEAREPVFVDDLDDYVIEGELVNFEAYLEGQEAEAEINEDDFDLRDAFN